MPLKLLTHELKLKLANAASWLLPLVFFSLVLMLFPIVLGADKALLTRTAVAAVWIAMLLSVLLACTGLFDEGIENGYVEQLIVSGISPTLWVMIKCFVHWLLSGCLLSIMAFLVAPLFGLSFLQTFWLVLTLLLGTPVLVLFSALAASLTQALPTASALVPIIALPLMLPVVIFSVSIPEAVVAGFNVLPTLALLAAMCIASMLCLPWVIAQSIRLALQL